jgi:hypothetical protein
MIMPIMSTAVRISNETTKSGVFVLKYQKMDGF